MEENLTPDRQTWLFSIGFRPFFLAAAILAVLGIVVWMFAWTGSVVIARDWADGTWHAHEMIFGFAYAVVSGFLLTAVYNWTGLPHLGGIRLAALVLVWLGSRLAMLATDTLPGLLVMALDVAYLPILAATVAAPLRAVGNKRNMIFLPILGVATVANLAMHLDALGMAEGFGDAALLVSLDSVVLIIVIIAGRITPSFTRNAIPDARIVMRPWVEKAAILSMVAITVLDAVPAAAPLVGVLALAAAPVHALRLGGWGGLKTLHSPILWVLHLAYAWLVIGLAARGLAALTDIVPRDVALHALTIGTVGILTLGMMSRVALGHTGRPLRVKPAVAVAYVLLLGAVLMRVFGPLADPSFVMVAIIASGTLWALAFAIFTMVYFPIFMGPPANR